MPRVKNRPKRHISYQDRIWDAIQLVGQGYQIYSDYTGKGLPPGPVGPANARGYHAKMESGGRTGKFIKANVKVMPKKSLQFVVEQPGVVEDYNCVYVGHSTLPTKYAFQVACTAIARLLCSRLGTPVTSMDVSEIKLDGILSIFYRVTPAASSGATVVATYSTSTENCLAIGTAIYNALLALIVANPNIVFDSLRFVPETDGVGSVPISSLSANLVFSQMHLDIGVVSDLKIQNATKHEVGESLDAELTTVVDAVPLIGKIYSGKGQGVWEKSNNTLAQHDRTFLADPTVGAMIFGATSVVGWQEPVNENILKNVSKVNGVKFEPGEIHTSRLVDSYKGNLQTYFIMLAPQLSTTALTTRRLGKFSFVGLEKLIGLKAAVASTYTPVRVIYELNQTWNAFVSEKFQLQTLQMYSKNNNVSVLA